MSIILFFLAAAFMSPVGIYFYFFIRRFLTLFGIEKKTKKSRLISIFGALFFMIICLPYFGDGMIAALHIVMVGVVIDIASLFLRRVKTEKFQRVWGFIYKSGILAIVVTVAVLCYGYFNMANVQRTEYDIYTSKALAADMKVVQISDLHTGGIHDREKMQEIFDRADAENADLVVLTGDIFDETTTAEEMKDTATLLGEIDSTYGTYFIYGNHDTNQYAGVSPYTMEEMEKALTDAGIEVLKDQVVWPREDFALIGRLDASFENRASIKNLTGDLDKDKFLLLLDHQPTGLEESAEAGADLQLAGHTHGGQIWPMGLLSKLVDINEEYYGLHSRGDFDIIVSSGVSGWGYPIRTETISEYVVINIKSDSDNRR